MRRFLAPATIRLVFGERWLGLDFVLGLIGFMNGIVWIVGVNSELFRAIGRPDINSKLLVIAILYYLPAYLLAAPFGLEIFTYVRFAVGLISVPLYVFYMVRIFNFSPFYLWKQGREAFVAGLGLGVCLFLGVNFLESPSGYLSFIQISVLALLSALCYIFLLWIQDRSFISNIMLIINRAFFQKYE